MAIMQPLSALTNGYSAEIPCGEEIQYGYLKRNGAWRFWHKYLRIGWRRHQQYSGWRPAQSASRLYNVVTHLNAMT